MRCANEFSVYRSKRCGQMEDKILALHPEEGKSGVDISREKYQIIKESIVESLRVNREMTFKDLTEEVRAKLVGRFDGSIPWYITTVKLDLEARGVVERVPKKNPQRLRLIKGQDHKFTER